MFIAPCDLWLAMLQRAANTHNFYCENGSVVQIIINFATSVLAASLQGNNRGGSLAIPPVTSQTQDV